MRGVSAGGPVSATACAASDTSVASAIANETSSSRLASPLMSRKAVACAVSL